MSFRLPDVLRRHHSTTMRYLQVKAVTFEEIAEVSGLTTVFNVLKVLLPCNPTGQFSSKSKNRPVEFATVVPTTLSYTYNCPYLQTRPDICQKAICGKKERRL